VRYLVAKGEDGAIRAFHNVSIRVHAPAAGSWIQAQQQEGQHSRRSRMAASRDREALACNT
jgi:hypothetical protein